MLWRVVPTADRWSWLVQWFDDRVSRWRTAVGPCNMEVAARELRKRDGVGA